MSLAAATTTTTTTTTTAAAAAAACCPLLASQCTQPPGKHSNITDSLEPEQAAEVEGVWSKFEGASTQEKVWDEDKKRWEVVLVDEERALAEVVTLPIGAGGSKVDLLGNHIDRLRPGNWLFDERITM